VTIKIFEDSAAPSGRSTRRRGIVFVLALVTSAAAAIASELLRPDAGGLVFDTPLFIVFFAWFFVLFHFVAASTNQRTWLIVVGSLLFYGSFGIRLVPAVVATGLVDFFVAKRIAAERRRPKKQALLAVIVAMNVALLAASKYLVNAERVAPTLALAIPIGVSFYTLEAVGYGVDVYRGKIAPCQSAPRFLAALTFFPHLVAGPILRSSRLLPQLEAPARPRWIDCKRAFLLIAAGLANKELADLLALAADPVFAQDAPRGALATWTGALAFGGQIFGDFCGYADIAIGVALLLGFTLPTNFDLPFLATSPIELWKRWQISLSTWLRDYLWIPLARTFPAARYPVLLVAMIAAGLWHGAAWAAAAWGLYQGVVLLLAHLLRARLRSTRRGRVFSLLGWLSTFYFAALGFPMLRATSLRTLAMYLREMHAPVGSSSFDRAPLVTLALVVAGLVAGHLVAWLAKDPRGTLRKSLFLWPIVTALVAASLVAGRIAPGSF
jgi:D-alanyl-lipoteichoic acid acyltransferase DltB (MBOAT superfamily)